MTTFTLSGKTYKVDDSQSTSDLADAYNAAASFLKEKAVSRFSDKATALKRTLAIVGRLPDDAPPAPEPKVAAPAPKTAKPAKTPKEPVERRKRQAYFTFPVADSIRKVRDSDSLRGQCVVLLTEGATFAQIEKLVNSFDGARGSSPGNLERRTYELIRIMHYYLGYGMTHNAESGVIKLRTK